MFLYGMNLMSSGLQKAAGERLRGFLSAMTSNPLKGVMTGLGITTVIQSSSATTVMVVSFVNAGLLTLAQAKILKADVATANIPIIFCTARDTEDDMVMGLNLGADDYIMKPYTVRNVIARVKSVLRRAALHKSNTVIPVKKPNQLSIDGLCLDLEFKRCTVDGKEIKLARKEFELLAYLIQHRGKICSREQILSRVWSDEVVVLERTIDVNITRLRSKIGAYGSYIVTRSGFGYGFRD